ncbi:MAG TPA: glutaredoxin family protein [Candidatus Limnocylindrales bacterium]|nr:glutaredoxin family protein [Candidatus Limnocylindrales bacterium]
MKVSKVSGKNNKHKVILYALSTCVWCKLTKQYLNENNVEYEYVDVDLSSEEDKQKIHEEIESRGGTLSYPSTIIDDKILVSGFRKDKLGEALGLGHP